MKGETLIKQGLIPLLRGIGPIEIGPVEVRIKGRISGNRGLLRLGFYGLILGVVGGAGYVMYTQLPDLRRYLKIRSM